MYVRDYMSTELVSTSPDSPLIEVMQPLLGNRFRHLPICQDGKLVGLITQTDFLRQLVTRTREHGERLDLLDNLSQTKIADAMITDLATVAPMDPVERAALLMRDKKVGCLPVVEEDGTLVGIVTETDIFDAMVDALGLRRGGARVVKAIPKGASELATVEALVEEWTSEGLLPIAMAIYRPRNAAGDGSHLVCRLRGEGKDEGPGAGTGGDSHVRD